MTPIATLQVSYQSPITLKNKPYEQKTDQTPATSTVNFAKLLGSVTAEDKIASGEVVVESVVSDNITSENQQGELLEKLEDVLLALQEIPLEKMSPEEQEMMNAIIQMLSLQSTQLKERLQTTELGTEKLMNLLHQVDQELKGMLSNVSVIPFEDLSKFVGVEEKNVLTDPKKFEQLVNQLVGFIQQLESEQQASGKQTSLQQVEQMEQLLKQMKSMTEHLDSQARVTESQRSNVESVEISRQVPGNTVPQQPEGSGVRLEAINLEENSQVLTVPTTDTIKAGQATGRAEPTVPTPTVRISNLIEELGEVLRNSFRLNRTGEGNQIKVNIFPEHLGHLDIRITELNGKIAAQIFTSSLVAKEALDLQVNQMRNSLLLQGITIDKIEITQQHSSQSFGQQHAHPDQRFSQQQKQGTASGNKNGYQRMDEEATIERNHAVSGTLKVDYTI